MPLAHQLSGRLEQIEFDRRNLLAEVMQSLGGKARAKGLDLVYRVSPRAPRARNRPIVITILDTRVAGEGGERLVERIRSRGRVTDPRVILLGSDIERKDRWRALDASAQLTKPVRQSDLLDAIVTTVASTSLAGLEALANHVRQSETR